MAESTETITLNASCHCKSNNFDIVVPKSALPLRSAICQCNTCRHSTGIPAPNSVSFPYSLNIKIPDVSNLTEYKTSPGMGRYFCGTCGAHMFTIEPDCWDVTNGVLDQTGDLLERLIVWTDDTGDGGYSVYLKERDGKEIKSYRTSTIEGQGKGLVTADIMEEYKAKSKAVLAKQMNETWQSDEKMRCRCHCGGVDFYITRPDPNIPAPEPKLAPTKYGKYRCTPCPCESCRKCSGYEIQTWCYVPPSNIFWNDGTLMKYTEGTLKSYDSTPGEVIREFCKVCGAKVFYRTPKRRGPDGVIDISIGLFEGDSRAEEWLTWASGTKFDAYSVDIKLFEGIRNGLAAWDKETQEI
ncbi:hypothetical protein TWF694_009274 [Orbilia ellipsospora]|uniref:CENP-V/GFA domain-containing protein n=1 Tax=Orbilia ellipsospora TaxID=2528407 RepID=A0AAV9XF40_9PEZI